MKALSILLLLTWCKMRTSEGSRYKMPMLAGRMPALPCCDEAQD
jgi:hypothetical protein